MRDDFTGHILIDFKSFSFYMDIVFLKLDGVTLKVILVFL